VRSEDKKTHLAQVIDELEVVFESRDPIEEEFITWQNTHQDLANIHNSEEVYWSVRAKYQWIKAEDANIVFFHKVTSAKHKKHLLTQLEIDGHTTQETATIKSHVHQFYKTLFNLESERGRLCQ
jgi:hypothetical protein